MSEATNAKIFQPGLRRPFVSAMRELDGLASRFLPKASARDYEAPPSTRREPLCGGLE